MVIIKMIILRMIPTCQNKRLSVVHD
jgi:hypothetical protein